MSGRELAALGTTVAAVGSGLAGGVFFGFSSFVMSALRRLPPAEGIAAMQSINREAPTPAFMTLLFGTAALSAGLGVHSVTHADEPHAPCATAGTISYLVAIAITATFHVPRNNRLATFAPASAEGARYWEGYVSQWTTGNHLRTAACTAAVVFYAVAARRVR